MEMEKEFVIQRVRAVNPGHQFCHANLSFQNRVSGIDIFNVRQLLSLGVVKATEQSSTGCTVDSGLCSIQMGRVEGYTTPTPRSFRSIADFLSLSTRLQF